MNSKFRLPSSLDREENIMILLISSVLAWVEWFLSVFVCVIDQHIHSYILCTCARVPTGHAGSAMLIAGFSNLELQLSHLCWAAGLGNPRIKNFLCAWVTLWTQPAIFLYKPMWNFCSIIPTGVPPMQIFTSFCYKKMHMPIEKYTLEPEN